MRKKDNKKSYKVPVKQCDLKDCHYCKEPSKDDFLDQWILLSNWHGESGSNWCRHFYYGAKNTKTKYQMKNNVSDYPLTPADYIKLKFLQKIIELLLRKP